MATRSLLALFLTVLGGGWSLSPWSGSDQDKAPEKNLPVNRKSHIGVLHACRQWRARRTPDPTPSCSSHRMDASFAP